MEFRTFPQRKPEDQAPSGPPVFGRRNGPPGKAARRFSMAGLAGTAALGVGAAMLVYLVIETL
jgi:hypothetical protein